MRIRAIMAAVAVGLTLATVDAHADTEYRYQGEWAKTDRCQTEDPADEPDRLPCIWDAKHQGNGEGTSFVVRMNGSTKALPHRVAHCRTHWHLSWGC